MRLWSRAVLKLVSILLLTSASLLVPGGSLKRPARQSGAIKALPSQQVLVAGCRGEMTIGAIGRSRITASMARAPSRLISQVSILLGFLMCSMGLSIHCGHAPNSTAAATSHVVSNASVGDLPLSRSLTGPKPTPTIAKGLLEDRRVLGARQWLWRRRI